MLVRAWRLPAGLVMTACVLAAAPARAQGAGDGFLFRPPHGTVGLRGGFDRASASSDIFNFVTDELTVDRRDFSSPTVVFEVSYKLAPRFDVLFSVGSSRTTIPSEFRHWLDNNDRPIQQTTHFQRVPVTASIKSYLAQPGRSVGHFAWIPKRFIPYVGGGGGVTWYDFNQHGDFIDFQTLKVFYDSFESDGWAPTLHGFGGIEVSLTPRLAVTAEARYQWARAPLSLDFSGFDRIDLSGTTIVSGILVRY
jgi:hypothetical protein